MIAVLERIENTIFRYNMIPPGTRLGVAVSGGADSVFLLHYLVARGGAALTVLHVNHGLRGAESDGDCEFVRGLAAELGVPFLSYRMGEASGNLEQFCRRERLAFFARSGMDRVATGHTASDQAETVVMRLLRGAGTTGLRGVLPVTAEGLVRPLLGVRRDEIRAWLGERGLSWREDASNGTDAFLRNRVRARVMPVMREMDANCEAALGRVAEMAGVDEAYWRETAGAVLDGNERWVRGGLVLEVGALAGLHRALLVRVVRMGLERVFGSLRRLDQGHVERVMGLVMSASGEGAVEVPGGRVERSLDWVRIGGEDGARGEEEAGVGERLVRVNLVGMEGYTGEEAIALDWERLRPPLRLRGWRAGDRFQAVGRAEDRPVKEMLARERVPSWDRHYWPMITDSDGIVWIYRFGAAARAAAGPGTRIRLQVRCDTVSSK